MDVDGINTMLALVTAQAEQDAARAETDVWLGLELADFLALGGTADDPNY